MTDTTDTSKDAYREIIEEGEDVSLRRRVAAELAAGPKTTNELGQAISDHSANAIRPRVNELIRMGCVVRNGKRLNPSGHEAYVNHLTPTGEDYIRGKTTPEPKPTLSELQATVVKTARQYLRGEVDEDILHLTVEKHDTAKRRLDPDWSGGLGAAERHDSENSDA